MKPPAFSNAPGLGIAAALAAMTADRDAWRARAERAEAACTVAASARRLGSLRQVRRGSRVQGRGLFG